MEPGWSIYKVFISDMGGEGKGGGDGGEGELVLQFFESHYYVHNIFKTASIGKTTENLDIFTNTFQGSNSHFTSLQCIEWISNICLWGVWDLWGHRQEWSLHVFYPGALEVREPQQASLSFWK